MTAFGVYEKCYCITNRALKRPALFLLPSRQTLLDRPQDRIRNDSEHSGKENPHVPSVTAELPRDRADVPCLTHTRHAASEISYQERHHGGQTPRQLARLIPRTQIIPVAPPEPLIFDEEDQSEADGPVAEQAHKVTHDGGEVIFPSNGEDGDN